MGQAGSELRHSKKILLPELVRATVIRPCEVLTRMSIIRSNSKIQNANPDFRVSIMKQSNGNVYPTPGVKRLAQRRDGLAGKG